MYRSRSLIETLSVVGAIINIVINAKYARKYNMLIFKDTSAQSISVPDIFQSLGTAIDKMRTRYSGTS